MKTATLIALGAIVAGASAGSPFTVFDNQASFEAAAMGTLTEDFNSATPQTLNNGVSVHIGFVSVQHIGSDGNSFIDDGSGSNNIDGSQYLDIFVGPEFIGIFPAESFEITFPYEVLAAGFDLFDFFSAGSSAGAEIYADGVLVTDTVTEGLAGTNGMAGGFLGFTSATPFSTLTFASTSGFGEAFGIDNLQYSIPAPGAVALFGFVGLAGVRRRR